jgi:hypothetical protein
MSLKKFIARKTFPLRRCLGVTPLAHRNTEEGGVSLESAFTRSYAQKVNIDLFIKGRNDAVGAITSLGDFIVCGWLDTRYLTREKISLNSNGETLACEAVKCIGSKNAYGAAPTGNIIRFQFIIPGYIWRSAKTDQTLKLWISADSEYLHTQPLELSAGIMARWLEGIRKYRNQYFSLLALEHLYYFNTHDSLNNEIKTYFVVMALKHNLPSLPFANLLKNESARITANQTLDAGIVDDALKSFNDRLNLGANNALDEAEVAIKKYELNKKDKIQFLVRLIPFFCREDLFDQMVETFDLDCVKAYLQKHRSVTNLSILSSFYCEEGSLLDLSETLFAISKTAKNSGWIHTECIHFACRKSLVLLDQGLAGSKDHGEICYAFLAILESLCLDSFSRLPDHMLIETLAGYLSSIENNYIWLQRDLVQAAIKYYGLNSHFWITATNLKDSTAWLDIKFKQAYQHWQVISNFLRQPPHDLSDVVHSLSFFWGCGNVDVGHFSRVIVLQGLQSTTNIPSSLNTIVHRLARQNPLEYMRVSSSPQGTKWSFDHKQESDQIWCEIRRESGHENISYYLQKQAAMGLEAIISAIDEGRFTSSSKDFGDLVHLTERLSKPHHANIGIELCVLLLVRLSAMNINNPEIVDLVVRGLKGVYENTSSDEVLPPPVYSSLALITQSKLNEQDSVMCLVKKITEKNRPLNIEPITKMGLMQPSRNSHALYNDTIVVIYSCRKYLKTRIEAIRESWLKDVKAMGIPYLIVVGDGDDGLHDDVLTLNVSDTYEDLPHKSLKLYQWIHSHTDAQFVIKVDDDCFLNVREYFHSLSYRKHHYYGRILERTNFTMDRTWHQDKSNSIHASQSIDKSPTPSIYADGGSSYSLSRFAITKILEKTDTAEGHNLILSSYMEDKLIGDILALSDISPADEDLSIYIRRRMFATAYPVGMWSNSFYPSNAIPIKVTHLDTDKDMASTYARLSEDAYWPKKIWPTIKDASLQEHSNQLELLTPLEQAQPLFKEDLFVISVLRNEMVILPHFLDHYRSIGVKTFVIVDNLSDDSTREYLLEQSDVVLYSADTDYNKSHYGVLWQQAILSNHCLNKWVLMADADEFLVYPGSETKDISTYLDETEEGGYDCVRTEMIDMYPGGALDAADFDHYKPFDCAPCFDSKATYPYNLSAGIYSNHTAKISGLRHRLDSEAEPYSYSSQKYALIKYKPWMMFSEGLHDATGITVSDEITYFAHFKYHKGFKEKSLIEVERGQHYAGAAEYKRYLSLLAEMEGQFYDEAHSVVFDNSESFTRLVSNE